jgi:hypothetical protein
VCLRELRIKAAYPNPMWDTFGNAPWGGIGVLAAKGWLALLTDDRALGRQAAEWAVKHAQVLEPRNPGSSAYPASMLFMENETGGQLDEVRMFNRVLSGNEVQSLAAP